MADPAPAEAQPLPPSALRLWRIRSGAIVGFVATLVTATGVLAIVAGEAILAAVAFGAVAVGVAAWWVATGWVFRSYRWALLPETVELWRGVWIRRHEVLPRARVQNVTQTAGPVARSFGLATVVVHSAGVRTPNVQIPDLERDVAVALRAELLPRSLPA